MSYDVKKINEICDKHVEDILDGLDIEYIHDDGWIATKCIFHNGEKNNLKYRDGKWFCFSECRKSYTMIDVVMKALGVKFKQAVTWILNIAGLTDENIQDCEETVAARNKIALMKRFTKHERRVSYIPIDQSILNDIEDIHHSYIANEGFTDKTLTHFHVGFDSIGDLAGRVCFPIDAPNGNIISVSGRTVKEESEDNPRYKIVGHTKVKDTLYNISRIDESLGYVIVVEGFKDVMFLYQEGYKNAVATIGAGASTEQEKILRRLGVTIIAIGDNDEAGRLASQKLYNHMYELSDIRRIDLGEYTDIERDSICDLDFDNWLELDEELQKIIKER